jgi:hypothetical protein
MSLGELPKYTVEIEIVGTTISGNCSLGKVVNLFKPYNEIKMVITYTAVLLSMAQLVGLNSLNFLAMPSMKFIQIFLLFS